MGNRTIRHPDVEIIEHDLSGYTTTNLGTRCLVTGFAQKGEDLVPINITNRTAFLQNFGEPTNESEEYFYNAAMEVLNQGGFLYASKIPYTNDITGIYAASKFKINANKQLLKLNSDTGTFEDPDDLDEDGEPKQYNIEPISADGMFMTRYRSLRDLGLRTLSLIAPSGQDFISKDLVEEYETGESEPSANTIYLVDKTRAVYTRAPEVADKQENRDSRSCIGIVPVITTMCNTAWFQKSSTGIESDVPELYQPVRSLRTIEFPAGAASAAEYKPTKFVKTDLHTQLMKDDNTFGTSLSERAALFAQSCLANGNLVDGKLKPFVCNDVCVVVFKAFVSTEDGKIDFDVVESFVGSLDPQGRDEKGRTTFIDTIINNNSEYIYCFSNLENPQQVLNPDHGFVAGSDSEYTNVEEELKTDREYMAASLFSAYAARMLGFGQDIELESTMAGLAAPRGFEEWTQWETEENSDYSEKIMGSLRAFYNQDAKTPICVLDELMKGIKYSDADLKELAPNHEFDNVQFDGYMDVSDKYVTKVPTITYTILDEKKGDIIFNLTDDDRAKDDFDYESYGYEFKMGEQNNEEKPNSPIETMKLSKLTILNSTDYLRAIYDFESLVNADELDDKFDETDTDYFKSESWAMARQKAIQTLIVNSIEKSARFKTRLRAMKKAQINLDRLDLNFQNAMSSTNESEKAIGKKYVEDIFKSYNDTGYLFGIKFVDVDPSKAESSSQADARSLLDKKDALEAKLEAIVNVDTTKKEKMKPRGSNINATNEKKEFVIKYLRLKIYLESQFNLKKADMLTCIADILDDCVNAQKRFVESKRNTDDSNIMLGFYPEMAEPIITYTTIAQSLNKILDTTENINEYEIDVVCDAGISNIAQFVKQVYDPSADDGEDVGGLYQPVKYSSYFKFNKNTDLAYWKTIVFKYDTFCKYRGDCMFVTESPRGMVLIGNKQVVRKTKKDTNVDLNILPYMSKIAGFNTSYGAGYMNWYRTISDYTGDTLWIPPSIKAMGTYILTDKQYNWWDAPAGMRRGIINCVETSFNPTGKQADVIYDTNWNYAVHYLNDGIIQEGQKTFKTGQSALDRVNVRRLLCRIKRYVYFASKQFLYEPHTQATREKYVKTITPFFQGLVTRGGLYGFKIICDESNNTPEVIDRNELRVKIGVKPVKTIEYIIIDLACLNTGASWSEMDSI